MRTRTVRVRLAMEIGVPKGKERFGIVRDDAEAAPD